MQLLQRSALEDRTLKLHVEGQAQRVPVAVFPERATPEGDGFIRAAVPVCDDAAVVGIISQSDEVTDRTLAIAAEGVGFFTRVAPITATYGMLLTIDDGGCRSAVGTLGDSDIPVVSAVADAIFLDGAIQLGADENA